MLQYISNYSLINFSIHNNINFNSTLDILFTLSETCVIETNGAKYTLSSNDIFIFNPFQLYTISSGSGISICIRINYFDLRKIRNIDPSIMFKCNSSIDPQKEHYQDLIQSVKYISYLLISNRLTGVDRFLFNSKFEYLLYELLQNYAYNDDLNNFSNQTTQKKFQDILLDLSTNYNTDITLKNLAERHFLTQPYISSLFNKYLNQSYTQYLVSLRITKACDLLKFTDASIESIIGQIGFSSRKIFNKYFKEICKMTPMIYRKKYQHSHNPYHESVYETLNSPNIAAKIILENDLNLKKHTHQIAEKQHELIQLSKYELLSQNYNHNNFKHLTYVEDYQFLIFDHYKEMCFHYADEMPFLQFLIGNIIGNEASSVFQISRSRLNYHFGFFDVALDILNQYHLNSVFLLNVSSISLEIFNQILDVFLSHLKTHFSNYLPYISFCIQDAKESDLSNSIALLREKIKAFNLESLIYSMQNSNLSNHHLYTNDAKPDYLIVTFPYFGINETSIQNCKHILDDSCWKDTPFIVSDINLKDLPKNIINDTIIRTTYVINTFMRFKTTIAGGLFSVFSDFNIETGKNDPLFTGTAGLVSTFAFRKPLFFFYTLINRLINMQYYYNKNYIFSMLNEDYWLFLQNSNFYNSYHSKFEEIAKITYSTDYLNQYTSINYKIEISDCKYSKYKMTMFLVDQSHGCPYSYWLSNNSLPITSKEEFLTLTHHSFPHIVYKLVYCENQMININLTLQPCAFALLWLTPL